MYFAQMKIKCWKVVDFSTSYFSLANLLCLHDLSRSSNNQHIYFLAPSFPLSICLLAGPTFKCYKNCHRHTTGMMFYVIPLARTSSKTSSRFVCHRKIRADLVLLFEIIYRFDTVIEAINSALASSVIRNIFS